MKQKDQKKG